MFVLGLFTVGASVEDFMEQWYSFISGYGACEFLETFATIELEFHGMRFGIFPIAAFVLTTAIFAWWIFQRLSQESRCGRIWSVQTKKRNSVKRARIRFHMKRQQRALVFLCMMLPRADAMNEQQFTALMNNLGSLAQSSTVAAQAAATAAQRLEQATSSTSSASTAGTLGRNLETASKILKNPDVFDGTDPNMWHSWRHGFMNWLTYADSRFADMLNSVEKLKSGEILDRTGWTSADADANTKLYSILTSYLKGNPLQLSRVIAERKDGVQLWQLLRDQYAPATRTRQLALPQAISSFPCFDASKPMSSAITQLEQLVNEFELLSGKKYDNDILLGVLLRCSPEPIRNHLTLTVTPSTTYETAKVQILAFERSSKTWDVTKVIEGVRDQGPTASGSNQGPAPMEVDAVQNKGKGKYGKGKNSHKGKGKSWWGSAGSWFGGKSGGKQKGKSKGKHKGKEQRQV